MKSFEEARKLHFTGKIADILTSYFGIMFRNFRDTTNGKKNFPIKGQVILVSNCIKESISFLPLEDGSENEISYAMRRKEGRTIIGGCFIPSENNEVDVKRNKSYVTEIIDRNFKDNATEIDIISVNIGLRPMRETNVRVETDPVSSWLVHVMAQAVADTKVVGVSVQKLLSC